jgi:hypothetical protein
MTEQCLYWGILEVIRVPVVCEYSGLGYSCGQHVVVAQPVNNPAPAPAPAPALALLEFPSSRRFGAQAMDGDDAVRIRLAYSYGAEPDVLDDSVVSGIADRGDLAESQSSSVSGRSLQ